MKVEGDTRLWFDKADGQTMYGVFTDQRFYSSQYIEPSEEEREALMTIIEIVNIYSEWAKLNYMERRAGRDQIPLPQELINLVGQELVEDNFETVTAAEDGYADPLSDELLEQVDGVAKTQQDPQEG